MASGLSSTKKFLELRINVPERNVRLCHHRLPDCDQKLLESELGSFSLRERWVLDKYFMDKLFSAFMANIDV